MKYTIKNPNEIECANCGKINCPDAVFCESCGNQLFYSTEDEGLSTNNTICPQCGTDNNSASKYCQKCGWRLVNATVLSNETDFGVGNQIETISNIAMVIGIIMSIVFGINIIKSNDDFALLGVIIMIVGSIVSWLLTVCLRGFGRLVKNSDILVKLAKTYFSQK